MSQSDLDVIGVGNAIVDVLAKADDAFLATHDIPKGGMLLIDEDQARVIYDDMAPGVEVSGGSAANSIACVASLGGNGGFVGKVSADALGDIFRHDLRAMGVEFDTKPLTEGPGTGRCLINVTPDAQRSMMTFLGSAGYVAPDDIDPAQINRAAITFFEGYLFEQPVAREAFLRACEIAKENGKKTALTLSDASCVDRQIEILPDFISNNVDILLANDVEAAALFGTDDIDAMVEKARALCPLTAVTRSEKGSVLIPREGDVVYVDAYAPSSLIDTTGAGDAYAAGLLFGLARNYSLDKAGKLGSIAASEVISHFGARPSESLKDLAEKAGIL
ncbi:adenosine kinase [Hyphococcus sp. DH-69]|uniref:adenosine kinase n=1 Tax=Hyphococcus formosus TaxID=3143534 RepID=UPI00398AAE38